MYKIKLADVDTLERRCPPKKVLANCSSKISDFRHSKINCPYQYVINKEIGEIEVNCETLQKSHGFFCS